MRYSSATRALFDLQMFGIKLGLRNVSALLARLGDPHRSFPCIHIAGTNGKGSTAAFLAAVLSESGYRTGLYTSPHLVDFTERIRVDGTPIARTRVARFAAEMRSDFERLRATFFEATTALAFQYFAEESVDVAVVETGLGGRLDATNVVRPLASVVTSIEFDHTDHLGVTLDEIAREKGGIIKRRVPVYVGSVGRAADRVLREIAARRDAPYVRVRSAGAAMELRDLDRMTVRTAFRRRIHPFSSPLVGAHQTSNLLLAIRVAGDLSRRGDFARVDAASIDAGIRAVRERTGLRARLERIGRSPELVVDVAHNPAGIRAMRETWSALRVADRTVLVFGLLHTKDIDGALAALGTRPWKRLIATAPAGQDAWSPEDIVRRAGTAGFAAEAVPGVAAAVDRARQLAGRRGAVLVFGSHFLVGEYLARHGRSDESHP